MEIEEIISEKDRILNDLFEGQINPSAHSGNLKDLTPAQLYRQTALEMFLDNNWHHIDLEEAWNNILSMTQKGNEKLLRDKIINYYLDANELNKAAEGLVFEAWDKPATTASSQQVLPISWKFKEMIDSSDSIDDALGKLNKLLDDAEASRSLRYEFSEIINNINRQELYYGIRHVMPESLEMRMLINYGEEYIHMLETLNRPSFNTNEFADLSYGRIPLSPERLKELGIEKPYIAPNNIAELKELHQRFLQEFPKKAKEFILGQNIFVDIENRDAILGNDEFYQYTGMATASDEMPSIQMSNNLTKIYEKFLEEARQEYMYEKAEAYGFEDANEWFEAVYREVETDGPNTILWDKATKESIEYGTEVAKNKLNSYFTKPVISDAFPDEIGFDLSRVSPGNPIYNVVNNPLDPNIVTTIPDIPTTVVAERARLEKFIKNNITNPELQEGLLKRYLDFDEYVKGLPTNISEELLDYTNKNVDYFIDMFKKDLNTQPPFQYPLSENINSFFFDWEEPTPLEDMYWAEVEDWEIDPDGNPINPHKRPEEMSKFQQELESQYKRIIEESTDIPTNVDNVKTLDIENYKPITIEVLDEVGLHARPVSELIASFNNQGIPITILQDGNLKEVQMVGLLQQGKRQGETLDIYIPKDANINLDNVEGIKVVPTPTNVVDDINNKAINQAGEVIDVADDTTTDLSKIVGEANYKRFTRVLRQAPEIVKNIFNNTKNVVSKTFGLGGRVAQVADPGDILIEQSLVRMLPRLGLGSISAPALIAYTAYELTILLLDVSQAYEKAIDKQGGQMDLYVPSFMGGKTIEGEEAKYIDYDWKQIGKDTWQEMGEISDTWSLSWKISEPIIESVFKQSASISQEK